MSRALASGQVEPTYAIPAGAPSWITPELIRDTIETWQPYYAQDLTIEDALTILLSVVRASRLKANGT